MAQPLYGVFQEVMWGHWALSWVRPEGHLRPSRGSFGATQEVSQVVQRVIRDHSGDHLGSSWHHLGLSGGVKNKEKQRYLENIFVTCLPNLISFIRFQELRIGAHEGPCKFSQADDDGRRQAAAPTLELLGTFWELLVGP